MNSAVLDLIRSSEFNRASLNHEADRTGSGRVAVEKDFVISILLMLIAEMPSFAEVHAKMVFRGGTCIKKVFYPIETRFSEDLDFANLSLADSESLLAGINGLVGQNTGVTRFERSRVVRRDNRGIDFMLYYSSILQQTNHITFNLSTSAPLQAASEMEANVEPYFPKAPKVRALGITEILAEKMRALLQRKKPRDVFDIWFLTRKGIPLDQQLLRKKLQRSYEAAPTDRKELAKHYVIDDIVPLIKSGVTEEAWRNELGGLLLRPKPDRKMVVEEVCALLSRIGNISLDSQS